ncbi:MAG: RluA family pseudouridine synthase [Treponema sp.]|jgi:RluA family pseudouridine synthase|nr:RluA family pseudouridine synthase [Treponema sp.]
MKTIQAFTEIYCDESMVVLNKASGILTAADRYDKDAPRLDTAASEIYGKLFAVHRIDKETSGAVIYARTPEAHRNISISFQKRTVEKTYHALVYGQPLWSETVSKMKLLVNGDFRHRTVVNKMGKDAETYFRFIGSCGPYSWIEAMPKTGRTHQIRAHLSQLGFCIVCDPLYSGNQKPVRLSDIKRSWRGNIYEERPLLARLALHAWKISLLHPVTEKQMTFTAPYPKDLDSTRKQLAKLFGTDPLA